MNSLPALSGLPFFIPSRVGEQVRPRPGTKNAPRMRGKEFICGEGGITSPAPAGSVIGMGTSDEFLAGPIGPPIFYPLPRWRTSSPASGNKKCPANAGQGIHLRRGRDYLARSRGLGDRDGDVR